MTVIGLTGPSGSGKGKISEILSEYGYKHIDADSIYHDILIPPSTCLDELVDTFGKEILNENKTLNRHKLAQIVFGDGNKEKLDTLNRITHRYVCDKIREILRYNESVAAQCCLLDVPLLFEAGLDSECDFVIAVLADASVRENRISDRDGIGIEDVKARMASQKQDEFYVKQADFVIYNNGDEDELRNSLSRILDSMALGGNRELLI
ncbi:MAG: dephospho-CoA kinase [Ruminococcaceae bacterium]|nr:dephospho-CoA kinase [Oscillospiraceae bacterium]